MYDEQVKRLRSEAVYLPEKFSKNAELLDVLMKAADAIEKLQKRVPKRPHGDLIDRREAIIDANERAYDFWLSDDEVNATIQFLNEQTTIIPEEEGET